MQTSRPDVAADRLTDRVLAALAEARDESPLEFETPLYEAIDPEALNAVFRSGVHGGRVEFTYLGFRVIASADGTIELQPTFTHG